MMSQPRPNPEYADLYALETLQRAYAHVKENFRELGIDPLALEGIETQGVETFLNQLSGDLQARTYKFAAERGDAINLRDLLVQAALKSLLEPVFPPAFPSDPEPEKNIKWLTDHIEKGSCRVYAVNVEECLGAEQHERLLAAARERIEDADLLNLLACVLAARTRLGRSSAELLTPLLADIALESLDSILQQIKAFGREENFFHVHCTRVGNQIVILLDHDPRYDWLLPAARKRLREELSNLHYDLASVENQSIDLTRGGSLRFLDFELRLVKGKQGEPRVHYWLLKETPRGRTGSASPRRRYHLPRFLRPCANWLGRQWVCQAALRVCRKAQAIQVGWRHLPISLLPVLLFFFGGRSLAPWLCLAAIFVCNWRWTRSIARWAGRHKLDAMMGAAAAAALIFLYPLLSDIHANRPREVAASSFRLPGFYLGEHHGDSWWHGEPRAAVNYGLYVPPHFQDRQGPFPLIVFLHGYGERTKTRIFKAGLPQAIAKRFGTNKPNGPFEFIAFFPIDPTGKWQAGSAEVEGVLTALDYVIRQHRIDPARVYLTGVSAGGSGVWSLAQAYPDKWAAVAPVCSFDSPDVAKVRHIPAWIFHGAKDKAAPVERERILVKQLEEANADVRYTEYPNKEHGIWSEAYNPKDLYEWLAGKKKG